MKITIKVTKSDIKNGKPCTSVNCPVALALMRATHCKRVSIGTSLGYGDVGRMQWAMPSPIIQDFISRFDKNLQVKPFQATLKFS